MQFIRAILAVVAATIRTCLDRHHNHQRQRPRGVTSTTPPAFEMRKLVAILWLIDVLIILSVFVRARAFA